ncbi:uncharacterized protein LOC120155183 [Hibiscus syriacus]|uniref:uncharacterized protein LOC120155183 n=1 Tax=Hibiscus syriacus TaxID=106335 RepID=UPI001920C2FD|nr:uncharacterized protein LOC120155183 [Hibiscus syriacus]
MEESEFTAKVLRSPSSNSESLGGDDTVSSKINLREKKNVSNMVGVTGGEDSINCTKDWTNNETKQQLSPVSVLDCLSIEKKKKTALFSKISWPEWKEPKKGSCKRSQGLRGWLSWSHWNWKNG